MLLRRLVGTALARDREALARAALGPNVPVLSAALTPTASPLDPTQPEPACSFEEGVDVGDSSTVIGSIKKLVDRDQCCAACQANPKCVVAAILPATCEHLRVES